MRLNSVSPSLDTSEIMKSIILFLIVDREKDGGGGGKVRGRRKKRTGKCWNREFRVSWKGRKHNIPGQILRASETITLICKGHSSILHAKYKAVAMTRYGFVLRNSTFV